MRELIREQIPALRRYARALVRDRDGADDLVQDCLVRAINAEAQWKPGTNIRAWLFTILHNIYVGDRRKLARRPSLVPIDAEEWRLDTPANQVSSVELGELDRALANLPEQQRITVLLVGLQGMGYEEVAEVMGVPLGTVRSRLSRARQALQHMINPSLAASHHEQGSDTGAPGQETADSRTRSNGRELRRRARGMRVALRRVAPAKL